MLYQHYPRNKKLASTNLKQYDFRIISFCFNKYYIHFVQCKFNSTSQAYDNREAFVMCSAVHESDNGQVCEDQGNLVDQVRSTN